MEETSKKTGSLDHLTDKQIADLVKSNDELDKEVARMIKEELEDNARKKRELRLSKQTFKRLRQSPLEVINRSLFFCFLGSFLFSFSSVYSVNRVWFICYFISAFSCVLYTPNRKALKELLSAWPNLEDLIKRNLK